MSNLRPIGRYDWERIVLRAELPGSTKAVALTLAVFADATTGTRVRPGEQLLSGALGWTERAVRGHLATLRELGLLERVSRGHTAGRADEYRLAIPADGTELPMRLDPEWRRLEPKPEGPKRSRKPVDKSSSRNESSGTSRNESSAIDWSSRNDSSELPERGCTLPEPSFHAPGTLVPPITQEQPENTQHHSSGDQVAIATQVDARVTATTKSAAEEVDQESAYAAANGVLSRLPDLGAELIERAGADLGEGTPLRTLIIAAAALAKEAMPA